MPFLSPEERNIVKATLAEVLDDKDLKAQFKKASHIHDTSPNDHLSGQMGQYAGILKEIMDERAEKRARPLPKDVVHGPSLEQLRKKYLGPNAK